MGPAVALVAPIITPCRVSLAVDRPHLHDEPSLYSLHLKPALPSSHFATLNTLPQSDIENRLPIELRLFECRRVISDRRKSMRVWEASTFPQIRGGGEWRYGGSVRYS